MEQPSNKERRRSRRIPATRGMRVYAHGLLMAHGTTVDMSVHGLQLRIQQDYSEDELTLGRHLVVKLEYSEKSLPIRVVRRWDDRIAGCFVRERVPTA